MVYLPGPAWTLILEFHNAVPLRREKKAIADACAKRVRKENRRRKKYDDFHNEAMALLYGSDPLEYGMREWLWWWSHHYYTTATWRKVQRPHWHPRRRFPALIDRLQEIRELRVPELKRRLKANGVRGYSKMRKQELITAYVKLL